MFKFSSALFVFILFALPAAAQDTLPSITVKNMGGQIVVSWTNNYKQPIANISIQRSYDSLKNYTTIGAVLNPQNIENGYADERPPYNKMYYRVFVSFEGGNYLFSQVTRPVKNITATLAKNNVPGSDADSSNTNPYLVKDNWIAKPALDNKNKPSGGILPKGQIPNVNNNTEIITYPSRRIFTAKDNNVVITLSNTASKKYTVKFYTENDEFLFELTKITEDFLIIEKVNFTHAGWFHFDVYESGKLIEKNKFYVAKDGKHQQTPGR
jgi:hypothetical protein